MAYVNYQIVLENEGGDDFLFKEESTGHVRGVKADGETTKLDQELCGQLPTGNMA